jgi:hypothetical protein
MLIAKFPYIIVLTPDLAGPADDSKASEAPLEILNMISYYLFPFIEEESPLFQDLIKPFDESL